MGEGAAHSKSMWQWTSSIVVLLAARASGEPQTPPSSNEATYSILHWVAVATPPVQAILIAMATGATSEPAAGRAAQQVPTSPMPVQIREAFIAITPTLHRVLPAGDCQSPEELPGMAQSYCMISPE